MKNQRYCLTATVDRFGIRDWGFPETVVYLRDVTCKKNKRLLSGLYRFSIGKRISRLNLKPGDAIEFNATVVEFTAYFGEEKIPGCKITNPAGFSIVESVDRNNLIDITPEDPSRY